MKKYSFFLLSASIIFSPTNVNAQAGSVDSSETTMSKEIRSVTKHSITINGKQINYTAVAGALILKNEKSEPIALFGYVAYTKDGENDLAKRPVTFAFNGGPGTSSYWLHIGVHGPKRVVVNDPETNPPPPYKMEDNANSILDVSDIVMIDPVGTGLSRPIGKASGKDFWGVDQDIRSVSGFIKQYVTINDRWNSPKYLLGESYGTTRGAGVVNYLQENMGMVLNGLILVSSILDFHLDDNYNEITFSMYLPTYAATAWYHNKIAEKSEGLITFLKEVRIFALGDYAAAIMKGDNLNMAEKENVANKLSTFIGISKEYILKANLRISEPQFTQELLRNEHLTVGRIDSRYKGFTQNLLSENAYTDPQSDAISPAFTAVFMNYFFGDLKMDKSLNYKPNAYNTEGFDWDWKHNKNGESNTPNTAIDLAEAMNHNPALKVLVMNGYYDLATPFFATEYTFDHMNLEKKLKQNVTMKYYEAGHMMYINPTQGVLFKKDLADFIIANTK